MSLSFAFLVPLALGLILLCVSRAAPKADARGLFRGAIWYWVCNVVAVLAVVYGIVLFVRGFDVN